MNILKLLSFLFLISFSFSAKAQKKAKAPKPEKQYVIYERGTYMTSVDVRKELKSIDNIIQIDALNVSGGSALVRGEILPGAEITQVLATVGAYNLSRQISKSGRGESLQMMNVVYPIRLRITISNQILDVEIKEAGFWRIAVGLSK